MKKFSIFVALIAAVIFFGGQKASATCQQQTESVASYGTLTANVWRQTGDGTPSGNTKQWNYLVSAVYSGNKTVSRIRTTWQGSAALRDSASIDLGISLSGISAGESSSWQFVKTFSKYWENNNGAKSSSYSSNMIVNPSKYYESNSVGLVNTALLVIKNDPRNFQISASV